MVVEKSADERWPRLERGTAVPEVVLVPLLELVVPLVEVVPLVVVADVEEVDTCKEERGVKFTGTFRPDEAMAAVSCRV